DSIYKLKREAVLKIFIGIALAVFLGYIMGRFGMLIGAVVLIIGAGKYVIAMMDEKHEKQKDFYKKNESDNNNFGSTDERL
ncbi:MAG: hypothetical protein IKX93_01475, partial [Bacteroidaceae bacterium]|nr:hypothetical protein [Bacteroidaceae bacterium]